MLADAVLRTENHYTETVLGAFTEAAILGGTIIILQPVRS